MKRSTNVAATALLFVAVLCCMCSSETRAAKILSVFTLPGPSQYIFGSALLKALAERGHEVTSISMFPQKTPLKNFRDVVVGGSTNLSGDFMSDIDNMSKRSYYKEMNIMYATGLQMCENVFEHAEVKQLLHLPDVTFDLIIVEVLATEAMYGLAQHFGAPIIGVSTFGTIGSIDRLVGNTSPVSYVPHMILPLTSEMSYAERLRNLVINVFDYVHYNHYYLPKQRALYQRYFPHAKATFDDVSRNFSLVLLNQHFSLSHARPYVSNMIEVGGLHIKQQPDALPHDMQTFLDSATEGAVYFSMGSNLKCKHLSPAKLQIFLNTFRALKMKVLWKFENADLPNKPDNVFISPWYPQPSVLAHPNVKAFISHGGLLSTTESIFHAKPILALPMFADQPMNAAHAVKAGYAVAVDFAKLSEGAFRQALDEVLYNPRYTANVRELSRRLRDQQATPMDTAIFWVEYVLRHAGAPHMRNAGQDLSLWQYHSLDTIATLVLVPIVLAWLLAKFVGFIICRAFGKKQKSKRKQNQKRKTN